MQNSTMPNPQNEHVVLVDYANVTMNPIAYNLKSAAATVGYSIDTLQKAIHRGDLTTRYANSKPIILHEELLEWARSLPFDPP